MPSPRPVKPSRSVVVAFTEIRSIATPSNSASRARIAGACGVIFGRSQIIVTSALASSPAARRDPLRRMAQEPRAVRILPGILAGREMPADIALRQRAINRVAQRMDADIRIRMPGQAMLMRHRDAAEDHRAVRRHGVDVKSGADTGDHGLLLGLNAMSVRADVTRHGRRTSTFVCMLNALVMRLRGRLPARIGCSLHKS